MMHIQEAWKKDGVEMIHRHKARKKWVVQLIHFSWAWKNGGGKNDISTAGM